LKLFGVSNHPRHGQGCHDAKDAKDVYVAYWQMQRARMSGCTKYDKSIVALKKIINK